MDASLAFDQGYQFWKVPVVFEDTGKQEAVYMQSSIALRFL